MRPEGKANPALQEADSRNEKGGRDLAAVLLSPPVRTAAGIVAALVVVGITVRFLRGTCDRGPSWGTFLGRPC